MGIQASYFADKDFHHWDIAYDREERRTVGLLRSSLTAITLGSAGKVSFEADETKQKLFVKAAIDAETTPYASMVNRTLALYKVKRVEPELED